MASLSAPAAPQTRCFSHLPPPPDLVFPPLLWVRKAGRARFPYSARGQSRVASLLRKATYSSWGSPENHPLKVRLPARPNSTYLKASGPRPPGLRVALPGPNPGRRPRDTHVLPLGTGKGQLHRLSDAVRMHRMRRPTGQSDGRTRWRKRKMASLGALAAAYHLPYPPGAFRSSSWC